MKKLYFVLRSIKDCKKSDLLGEEIINHCSKYKGERYTTSVLAYSLLFELLEKIGVKERNIFFSDNGKPHLPNGYISISHSNGYILVSYSEIKHGLDIQYVDKNINKDKIMNKYFPSKMSKYSLLNDEEKEELFYSSWVKKEAYVKTFDLNVLDFTEFDVDCYFNKISFNGDRYYYSIYSEEEIDLIEL